MLTVGYWFSISRLSLGERSAGMLEYPNGKLALLIVMGIGLGMICMVCGILDIMYDC